MVSIRVDLSRPVMIRMAVFCTLLGLLVLILAGVAQEAAPYSSKGRMLPVYTCLSILVLAPQLAPGSFFRSDNLLVALISKSLMCLLHVSHLSNLMPR
jgi:hypothetical protein